MGIVFAPAGEIDSAELASLKKGGAPDSGWDSHEGHPLIYNLVLQGAYDSKRGQQTRAKMCAQFLQLAAEISREHAREGLYIIAEPNQSEGIKE